MSLQQTLWIFSQHCLPLGKIRKEELNGKDEDRPDEYGEDEDNEDGDEPGQGGPARPRGHRLGPNPSPSFGDMLGGSC